MITPLSYSYQTPYNDIHDVSDISDASGVITEPVSVIEIKNFMRLEGFENDQESGELLFSSDDLLIGELITSAREGLERWCGISIIEHRWQVLFTNQIGNIELPYSNNATIVSLSNSDNVIITSDNYLFRGTSFKYMASPGYDNMTVVYTSGYAVGDVPKRLKQAIMRDVVFHYENRGEKGLSSDAMGLASSFKRVSTWLA